MSNFIVEFLRLVWEFKSGVILKATSNWSANNIYLILASVFTISININTMNGRYLNILYSFFLFFSSFNGGSHSEVLWTSQ